MSKGKFFSVMSSAALGIIIAAALTTSAHAAVKSYVVNVSGKIISVMDVRLRFKKEPLEYNDRTCIIVIQIEDISVGLIVDGVCEVIDIPDCQIVEPPEISKIKNKFIKGIGKVQDNVKLLLDCDKLLNHEDADSLSNI